MGPSNMGRRRGGLGPVVWRLALYLLCLLAVGILGIRADGQAGDMAVYRLRTAPAEGDIPADVRCVLVQREEMTVSAGGRSTVATVYRVNGDPWTDLLGVRVVDGHPADMSADGAAVLSRGMVVELFGAPLSGEEAAVAGKTLQICGICADPAPIDAWWMPEDRSLYLCSVPAEGEVMAVLCFPPGAAAIMDYRLRAQWGSDVLGYAPLYMGCEWARFLFRLLLWMGMAGLVWAVFPASRRLLRRWVWEPLRDGYARVYLGEFLLRHAWRAGIALLALVGFLAGLLWLARMTFPVLPLPAEVLPGILIHVDALARSVLSLRQYCLAHPAPVLPVAGLVRGMLTYAALCTAMGAMLLCGGCRDLRRIIKNML